MLARADDGAAGGVVGAVARGDVDVGAELPARRVVVDDGAQGQTVQGDDAGQCPHEASQAGGRDVVAGRPPLTVASDPCQSATSTVSMACARACG